MSVLVKNSAAPVLLLAIGLAVSCIWAASAQPSDYAPKFRVPKMILATTPNGRPVTLYNGGATDFLILATWCPYSKQLKKFLNDPVTRPYAARRKMIFLFSNNEWADVGAELKDSGMSAPEVKRQVAKLRAESGSSSLFDPSFLDDVPGEVYLCNLPKEMEGFPSVISGSGRDKLGWLAEDLKMPEGLLLATYKKYAPK
jgi:hypothetical protein